MNTILVVDDDKVFRGLLKTVFEMEGYQTAIAAHPDEVIPTARQVRPALVLMDVHIAHGDTLDVLREFKQDEMLKEIPVIMTSGMDRSDACLDAGADSFVLKPFRPSEILEVIEDFLM